MSGCDNGDKKIEILVKIGFCFNWIPCFEVLVLGRAEHLFEKQFDHLKPVS